MSIHSLEFVKSRVASCDSRLAFVRGVELYADLMKKALETKSDVRSEQELSFDLHRHEALGESHVRVQECGTGRWKLMQMDAEAIQSSTAPQQGQRSGSAHVERARS